MAQMGTVHCSTALWMLSAPHMPCKHLAANADGSGEHAVSAQKSLGAIGQPAWSPDGRIIVWSNRVVEATSVHDALIVTPVDGTKESVIPSPKLYGIWGIQWTNGGRGLVI